MATIKKFNSENFNVNVVDAMNLETNGYAWYLDLKVEVTDKETGIKVYDTVLKDRNVPMWDTDEDWCEFIENKIEDGAEIDEDLDYWDADKNLQKEFDDWFEERYIDCFLEEYELDEEDLSEIFDEDCYNLVIIDGDNVWFTDLLEWDEIGYNADTENSVYECDECDEYIIEELDWTEFEVHKKNDIKIIEELPEEAA